MTLENRQDRIQKLILLTPFPCAFCGIPRHSYEAQGSSIRFSISGAVLRSLVHLELNFVPGDECMSICILLHAAIQFNQHYFWKMLSFLPVCTSGFFIKNQLPVSVWIFVWSSEKVEISLENIGPEKDFLNRSPIA